MSLASLLKRYFPVFALFIALTGVYLGFTLVPAPDPNSLAHYHIQASEARLLTLTIIIPYLIIWVLALVGFVRLRYYADLINHGKDGRAFTHVSRGILVLALWLPTSAALGATLTYVYVRHPGATATLTIINNYVNLLILVVAFVLLDQGAKKFAAVTRTIKNAPNQLLILGFLAFATLYTWLSLNDEVRRHAAHGVSHATYYEPDWLIVLTIIIPRLIMWFLGMQAVQNIYYYRHKVKGTLYKGSLFRLSAGIGWVVIATVALGCVQSLTVVIQRLGLGMVLLIIYALLILIGAGYYLIAQGSKKLLQIETS